MGGEEADDEMVIKWTENEVEPEESELQDRGGRIGC